MVIYMVGENSDEANSCGIVFTTTLDMLRNKDHKSSLTYGKWENKPDVIFYENLWTANKLHFYAIAGKE